MKYLLETPIKGEIGTLKYATKIHWRNGVMITDEPQSKSGLDLGPDPFTLLLSSLVACTLATLRMYIDHKGYDIPEIKCEANMYQRIKSSGTFTHMERKVDFCQELPEDLIQRLLEIAEKCPVSLMLKQNVLISTELQSIA